MKTRMNYDWEAVMIKLRAKPGVWVLTHQDVPVDSAQRIVRLRKHPALVGWHNLETDVANTYRDESGQLRGILWMRYTTRDV